MNEDRQLILFARVIIVLHRVLERHAKGADLSIPQYRFLLGLKRGAKRASELATLSGIGRPSSRCGLLRTDRQKPAWRPVPMHPGAVALHGPNRRPAPAWGSSNPRSEGD